MKYKKISKDIYLITKRLHLVIGVLYETNILTDNLNINPPIKADIKSPIFIDQINIDPNNIYGLKALRSLKYSSKNKKSLQLLLTCNRKFLNKSKIK